MNALLATNYEIAGTSLGISVIHRKCRDYEHKC